MSPSYKLPVPFLPEPRCHALRALEIRCTNCLWVIGCWIKQKSSIWMTIISGKVLLAPIVDEEVHKVVRVNPCTKVNANTTGVGVAAKFETTFLDIGPGANGCSGAIIVSE